MFGIGMWEVVVIVLVALLVLGPDKLPQVARQVGRGLQELRKASSDLQASFQEAIHQSEEEQKQANVPHVLPAEDARPRTETSTEPENPSSSATTAAAAADATAPVNSNAPAPEPVPAAEVHGGETPHTLAG